MPKSLISETLYEVRKYYFGKRKFYKCKEKVLNFIQTLTNEKKVINPTAFHTFSPSPKEMELMHKFLDTTNHVCKIRMQMVNYWTCPDTEKL